MKSPKIFLSVLGIFLILNLINLVSAYDISKTWTCSSGLTCSYSPLCQNNAVTGPRYEWINYNFNAPQSGEYECTITIKRGNFGYYTGDTQTNEAMDLKLNGIALGNTGDEYCNGEQPNTCSASCPHKYYDDGTWRPNDYCAHCSIDVVDAFTKTLNLILSNTLSTYMFNSHAYNYLKIECNKIEPVICQQGKIEQRQCGSTDVGECSYGTETRTCSNNQWSNWQGCNAILPSSEICDELDNNCNGEIDEGGVCNTSVCSSNLTCGVNGYVGNYYCNLTDNYLYINYKSYICNNPGTLQSYCSNQIIPVVDGTCNNLTQCADGIDNDGDGLIDLNDPGCSSPLDDDESNEILNCTCNLDCGINNYIGNNYCLNGDVYRNLQSFLCTFSNTINSFCSNSTIPVLIRECDYGCSNGVCKEKQNDEECANKKVSRGEDTSGEDELFDSSNYISYKNETIDFGTIDLSSGSDNSDSASGSTFKLSGIWLWLLIGAIVLLIILVIIGLM